MTFATFNISGNIPAVKEILDISTKCSDILLSRSLIIFVGILFGPVDLQLLNEEIIFNFSLPVAGAIMDDSKWKEIFNWLTWEFIFARTDCAKKVNKLLN